MVEASPDSSILEFQDLVLGALRKDDDDWTKRLTSVKLHLAETELKQMSATLAESGVAADTTVLAVFSRRKTVECACKEDADSDLTDANSLVGLRIPDGTTEIPRQAFKSCNSILQVSIPDSLAKIRNAAFGLCHYLEHVTIPSSVIRLEVAAFYNCRSLRSLTIPHSVTNIESAAFHGCISLASLTLPDSLNSIGRHAFHGCKSLTSLTIPDSVNFVGYRAFFGCSSLMMIRIAQRQWDEFKWEFEGLPPSCCQILR